MRNTTIKRHVATHAEGSALICVGHTKVLCTASVSTSVPRFLRDSQQGWLTAQYGMLPRATHERVEREAFRGKQSGRTQEIQRLIGRSLRAAIDLTLMPNITITIDCDVLQADGGTRTAAITGGCVALYDAVEYLIASKKVKKNPFKQWIAATSAGIVQGQPTPDLDYQNDSQADTDMNIIMNEDQHFIEIQGTAEKQAFSLTQLQQMLELARAGIIQLIDLQKQSINNQKSC